MLQFILQSCAVIDWNIDALLPRDFQDNMNYWQKSEDKVQGLSPVSHVTLKNPLGNSDIPLVVIIDFLAKIQKTRQTVAGIFYCEFG